MASYLEQNQERFLSELMDWLRIPSVSADPKFHGDVLRAAEYLKARFEEVGLENVELCPTAGNPIVYGEKIIDPNLPTVLVYGHYDVQPADPYELWTSGPFEPLIKDGKIYARGACDDKGQVYMHVKAFEMMQQGGGVPCNVKVMIEGEEEIGSNNLAIFVRENKEKLKADVILISDTGMLANDQPSIEVGLRGLSYHEVEVTGPNRDLHSGLYGGAVANPINILCKMIASLHDENNHITIPEFYNNVAVLSDEERAELNRVPHSDDEFKQSIGLPDTYGEKGYTTVERIGIRPTLDVNGIWGGYTGEGAKTVIASKAYAKISMRLVPHQTSEEITEIFQKHFTSIAPSGVTVQVRPHHGGEPVVTPTDSVAYKAAADAMETTFGKRPIPTRGGGSIPIVAMFKTELGLDTVLLGFGLDSDAIHSPNEHYGVFNFLKGIETIPHFYRNYAAAMK
ncbi:Acetylornithine deacetylase/Succinyl-diaminopimelate desuccinylase [Hymenobacter gelipurpurascens]|uniref:Acetylornithine deacetylase/Succinyl-diaminopimelate desuccinylase n=1 Tax=Hymenobacter gelipurpurascens TaxID=89968 RepID=A0A212UGX2_9BACT|nr:dipeptidase [Hymenobacter gelipurpurascens]SNC77495.1 Acetylornithine deacetylase/Succinyl-diaminopimelate desuccinylase [Hymenobacter gelipurpurascens]